MNQFWIILNTTGREWTNIYNYIMTLTKNQIKTVINHGIVFYFVSENQEKGTMDVEFLDENDFTHVLTILDAVE